MTADKTGGAAVHSALPIEYSNYHFDYSDKIPRQIQNTPRVPEAAAIPLSVADEKGATGFVLVASPEEGNTRDYYLNAYHAGHKLCFSAAAPIASAESSKAGKLKVENNAFTLVPATLMATDPEDEIITVVMADGAVYQIHTVHYLAPAIVVTTAQVAGKRRFL